MKSVIGHWSLVIGLATFGAQAAVNNLDSFARLPVQQGGRVMPVDSYARQQLLQFAGKSTFSNAPASRWFARTIFTPDDAMKDNIFLVNDASILEGVVSNADGRARFSFEQLSPAMDKLQAQSAQIEKIDEKERTPQQKEVVRLYSNLLGYFSLTHCFSFARADDGIALENEAVKKKMELPVKQERFSVLDIFLRADKLADVMGGMVTTNSANWTEEQQAVYGVSALLYKLSQMHRGLPMNLLPARGHDGGDSQWIAPWDAIAMGVRNEAMRDQLQSLQQIAVAFAAGSQVDFDVAAKLYEKSVRENAPESRSLEHTDLELAFNKFDPFYKSEILYGLAFIAGLATIGTTRRWLRLATLGLVLAALAPHAGGIITRMMIMGRPPVTNLYATFIFVGFICVLLGLAVEAFQRNGLGALLSAIAGLSLLLISGRFGDGDTMGVMIAVLDSNFWLSTHVVCISIGYAGTVFAGLFGATYLLYSLRLAPDDARRKAIARVCYGVLAFGLIFSFLGTMLGGVWADQSWGRFWGWDPKENGALLIVIWSSLLFHARISKIITDIGFAAGSALGIIVVLMAWLGINLLGVGLHSYGFTSALQFGFYCGCAVVLAFVGLTLPFVKRA